MQVIASTPQLKSHLENIPDQNRKGFCGIMSEAQFYTEIHTACHLIGPMCVTLCNSE